MKKFFTFALAMFSMVAMMSSCDNDDDVIKEDPEPEPEVVVKYNICLVAPLTDVQLEFMDLAINFTIADISATITPAKMETTSFPLIDEVIKNCNGVGKPSYYIYNIPGEYTEEEVLNGTVEYVATAKPEGITKYINGNFNCFGRSRTFVKAVDGDWYNMDNVSFYEFRGEVNPPSEKEFNLLLEMYNDHGKKTNFTLLPVSI